MRVFLCGFMGAGKTSVAPVLAQKWACDFADTDHLILKKTGGSLSDYFLTQGEAAFRKLESEVIGDLEKSPARVVALGGGALMNPENFMCVSRLGTLVYLSASLTELQKRLLPEAQQRPLLAGLSAEQILKRIHDLLIEREPIYRKANLVIDTSAKMVSQIADEIDLRLQNFEGTGK